MRCSRTAANGLRCASRPAPRRQSTPGPRLISREASFLALNMLTTNPRPGASAARGRPERTPGRCLEDRYELRVSRCLVGRSQRPLRRRGLGSATSTVHRTMHSSGAAPPAPLFFNLVDTLAPELPADGDPLLVPRAERRRAQGRRPAHRPVTCPDRTARKSARSGSFPASSPLRVSNVFRQVAVDSETGLRTCDAGPDTAETALVAFWPTEIDAIFRMSGIAYRSPPRWHPACSLDRRAATGSAPTIKSPIRSVAYVADRATTAGPAYRWRHRATPTSSDSTGSSTTVTSARFPGTRHSSGTAARALYTVSVVDGAGRAARAAP